MNAAVLVSNVVNRHKTWIEAVRVLEDFWMKGLSSAPDISTWVNEAKKRGTITGSAEAVRRHYSVKEYIKKGTPNVCSGPELETDFKFQDPDKWPGT